jgi:hypothetical protein
MKTLPLVIAASLAANAALLVLLFTRPAESTAALPSLNSQPSPLNSSPSPSPSLAPDPQLWARLDPGATDFPSLIARLQSAGFPPKVIRAIVAARIRADFAARRRAIFPEQGTAPFWQHDQPADPKVRTALRDLRREETTLVNQLFGGPDSDQTLFMSVFERRNYGDLPAEKVSRLAAVKRDYDEMRSEIYEAASGGTQLPEDRAKLALLEKEQRADFAQFLTPQELADYELRTSRTATQMRYNLTAFAPNEAEFRAIFALQKAFDDKFDPFSPGRTQDEIRTRGEEQKKTADQIKATLGPERGAEYERAIDYSYRQASLIAERLNLPKTSAADVWQIQKDTEQRTRELYTDRTLAPEARTARQAALLQEANAKVTTALGERGSALYKQSVGYWLQPPQPRPTPTAR